MKAFLFTVLILLCTIPSFSQDSLQFTPCYYVGSSFNVLLLRNISPGQIVTINPPNGSLFGDITFSNSRYKSVSVAPFIGKELNAKTMIGIQSTYTSAEFIQRDVINIVPFEIGDLTSNIHLLRASLFLRYKLISAFSFTPFIEPSINYGFLTQKNQFLDVIDSREVAHYAQVMINFGLLYKINEHFNISLRANGINLVNGYVQTKGIDQKDYFKGSMTRVTISGLFLGFEYKL